MINNYKVGDILVFKKNHPCGDNKWKVLKYGVECKLECVGCGRVVLMNRLEISKRIKNIISKESE